MTMPVERTRSLIWMREFLEECVQALPSPASERAAAILVDYPTVADIKACAMTGCGGWLEPLEADLD